MNFETLYHILFNAATDAIKSIDKKEYLKAKQQLIEAQQKAEMIYINNDIHS